MKMTCSDFEFGDEIPKQYTCDGRNMSPQFVWEDVPDNTKSFALIAEDVDAPMGMWAHWIVYNIPGEKRALTENINGASRLPDGTLQGINDFRKVGYGGPCPPQGRGEHRYIFRLYALDTVLALKDGIDKAELERALRGHIIEETQLMGRYRRSM